MVEGTPGTAFEDEVVVVQRRFANPESGFAVLDADRDGDFVVLVGLVAHLEDDERAQVTGVWTEDKRFGMQVKVTEARPLAPTGDKALLAYLRRVKHVGLGRAVKLLQAHGEYVLEEIDRNPEAAFRAAGIGARKVSETVSSWHALRSTRALHLMLAPHGLAYLVPRLHARYGEGAYMVVQERPYELTSVFGVGFQIADRIARAAGFEGDVAARARAALVHVLAEAERDGSTCLPVGDAARAAGELLGGPMPGKEVFTALIDSGDIVVELDGAGGAWAYRAPTARLEAELARRVRALCAAEPEDAFEAPGDAAPPAGDAPGAITPAPEQWAAVRAAFTSRLSVITGGPGTGKTATIRMICREALDQGLDVLLVAPTGRAARRVAESSGLDASTIHSALGWIPGEGPSKGPEQPLGGDLLIVDETSMANLELLVTLLRAVGEKMHVVLVGDADQLAPVGAGKPFAELVASEAPPVARLTHIFRQAAGSMIVRGAHAVRQGEAPDFAAHEGLERDLFLIERADPAAALDEIVSLVADRLTRHYGVDPVADVQVFAPVYKGPLGIDAINARLRAALNPDGRPVMGGRLRIGDKLMLSGRNLHELGLMNGTTLRLLAVDEDDDTLTVEADGAILPLPENEAGRLQLAYACSIHKGQGIELPVAVVVAHQQAGAYFLRREMLYTAMTRARRATVIVGDRGVVARAARTPDTARRHSRLIDRLAG